jgi:hypothetical protein
MFYFAYKIAGWKFLTFSYSEIKHLWDHKEAYQPVKEKK